MDKAELLERRATHSDANTEQDYETARDTIKLAMHEISPEDTAMGKRTEYQARLALTCLRLGNLRKSMDDYLEAIINLQQAIQATPGSSRLGHAP